MKKLVNVLILLCFIYFGISFMKNKWRSGHHLSYLINTQNNKFEIEETYQKKSKNHSAGYSLQIHKGTTVFPIHVTAEKEKNKIIESIYYFENENYQCIFPVGDLIQSDVLCQMDNTIYPYQNITGMDLEVDAFVQTLEKQGYDATQFKDRRSIVKTMNGISIYDNLVKNHKIGMEHYKGLYLLDSTNLIQNRTLFTNDIYQKSVETFQDKYYVVADYNQKYEFHEFYVINMITKKETKIVSNKAISFDSYIQGVVDNAIYLLDCSNKKQYRIHLSEKTVTKIGDIDLGVQVYVEGKWETRTMYDALKQDTYFTMGTLPDEINKNRYVHFDEVRDYYYLYEAGETGYLVYRVQKEVPSIRYFVTTISDFAQVVYIDDYFYWKENDAIYYYHDATGIRTVIQNGELSFNSNLQFGVYME